MADSDFDAWKLECYWCGQILSEGDRFRFELDYAGWKNGGLLAPEHPDFEIGVEPRPTCGDCRRDVEGNYDALRTEKFRKDRYTKLFLWALYILALFGLLAAAVGW